MYGSAQSTSGYGVYGINNNNIGVYGTTSANTGSGVKGVCSGPGGFGGYFQASGSGAPYALIAWQSNSSAAGNGLLAECDGSGYAIECVGDFFATGIKSFKIDHPLDPENKYLLHYCAEGPEPINAYSGNTVTDERGYAIVALPAYFSQINRDVRYQLTVIDSSDEFVLAKVAKEIVNNRFTIRTNFPHVKVSWRVEGVRNDLWVRKRGAPAEVDKPDSERGLYLNPDLYSEPPTKGITHHLHFPPK